MLPEPKSKYGFSPKEIKQICKDRGITMKKFFNAFGVNTCAVENNEPRYYTCDVERTLYKLGLQGGKDHLWD